MRSTLGLKFDALCGKAYCGSAKSLKGNDMKGAKYHCAIAAIGCLAAPQAALAGGYHYTHKAGVSQADWDAEHKTCVDAAKEVRKHPTAPTPYNPVTQSTVAGAAGAGFAAGFMQGMMRRKATYGAYYNCLKAHGYVERELSKEDFKEITALKGEARKARVYQMGSAENPPHPIMPEDDYN
jgi:hypothetical protein